MVPQYQFNVGYDPLLDPNNISDFNTYRQQLEQRIQQLNDIKRNIPQNITQNNQQQVVNNSHLIDKLDKELSKKFKAFFLRFFRQNNLSATQ